jgi:two-component system, OmpR family, sensor kinase
MKPGTRILLVEDDHAITSFVEPQLEHRNLSVRCAYDGEEAVVAARAAANGKVSIESAAPHRAVRAVFDWDRIRQAASILLDNATKYTPQGGNVAVRVGEAAGRAFLEVSDTGVGIPEEMLPLVFERFYRLDSARTEGGAGLGLSIARQIAEAHGGTIEVHSKPGTGSTFTLVLPPKPPTPTS